MEHAYFVGRYPVRTKSQFSVVKNMRTCLKNNKEIYGVIKKTLINFSVDDIVTKQCKGSLPHRKVLKSQAYIDDYELLK
jgi:hypothetical protein